MTARGSSAVNIIMFLTVIIACIIIIVWFMGHNPFQLTVNIDKMEEDLSHLGQRASNACITDSYQADYNPVLDEGYAEFEGDEICITIDKEDSRMRRCLKIPCRFIGGKRIDLSEVEYIRIRNGLEVEYV